MSQWWNAIAGATRYAKAIATGDIRTEEEAGKIAEICAACPVLTKYKALGKHYYTCGPAFEEKMDVPRRHRHCGCLVLAEAETQADKFVGLSVSAAGKTLVASESCPRGKW